MNRNSKLKNIDDRIKEKLSALLDDEATELEVHQLLTSDTPFKQSSATYAALHHYRTAQAVMHNNFSAVAATDISARVAQAIAQEEAHHISLTQRIRSSASQINPRMAIAASVAVVALSFSVLTRNAPSLNTVNSLTQIQQQAHGIQTVDHIPNHANTNEKDMEFYLAAHNANSSFSQPQTLSYARLATYSAH